MDIDYLSDDSKTIKYLYVFIFNKNNALFFIFLKILNILNIEYDRPKVWKYD